MVHLVICFSVWTLIFSLLFWRLIIITAEAISNLRRLHQIPCDKCAYFTGDYRLKCTVNPVIAMSEEAIGCRDFLYESYSTSCDSCPSINKSNKIEKETKYSHIKA